MAKQSTYEKLGAFYLGRLHDLESDRTTDNLLLYDAKDLTTHAVCVGMTGSGKTGLCVTLLEEAAIDGIPAIVIDPKGDLGNLLLTFPKLRPSDFRPWVDERAARRAGMTPDEYAGDQAALWKRGLADWDQNGDRIGRLRAAAELTIYTPGSSAGRPLNVLDSLAAPGPETLADADALRERVGSATSGLLALLGLDADPVRSREHVFLANLLDRAWRDGRSLDLSGLIAAIQDPPFERVGVMRLDTFFPAHDRMALAMTLNNLLAAPGFAAWMEGEPLNIDRLLYAEDGRPRIAILSIAHLAESERMFFVTLLLNEMVTWMRRQPGTASLRALLYMDEVFGYFPPTANPPSKTPMLTLLKQARAYGLGVVLATQNPVDLDYKGLSNTGTWFLGRLQTDRDKQRVLDGLEGASMTTGAPFDRRQMEAVLAGLDSRVFLMNNVHDDGPALFRTRWALSYLRGPLTRDQIRTLTVTPATPPPAAAIPTAAMPSGAHAEEDAALDVRPPTLPAGVKARPLAVTCSVPEGARLIYRGMLVSTGRLHYVRTAAHLDEWREATLLAPLDADTPDPWEDSVHLAEVPAFDRKPDAGACFEPLPTPALNGRQYPRWTKAFVNHLYREHERVIHHCRELKSYSTLDEDERAFRIRLRDALRERRDAQIEKLRKRYAPKIARLQDRVRKAEQRVEVERGQFKTAGVSTAVSIGTTVLGALFGRRTKSVGTVSRAGSTLRRAGRTAQQRGDIGRAEENVRALEQQLADTEATFEAEVEDAQLAVTVDDLELTAITLRPRKGDLTPKMFGLAWAPYIGETNGTLRPAFTVEPAEPHS